MALVGEIWVTTLMGFFQFNLVSDDFSTLWIESPKLGSAWKNTTRALVPSRAPGRPFTVCFFFLRPGMVLLKLRRKRTCKTTKKLTKVDLKRLFLSAGLFLLYCETETDILII